MQRNPFSGDLKKTEFFDDRRLAELVKQSTTLFRGLLMPGSWWQTCSEAVKNLKFLGKLSSVHAALVSYLAARFHSCAVTVQAAA